jgi:hypothetical protein
LQKLVVNTTLEVQADGAAMNISVFFFIFVPTCNKFSRPTSRFAAVHGSPVGRFCCKSHFAEGVENS